MSTCAPDTSTYTNTAIETVLREHTDIFEVARTVMAIAPRRPLDALLASVASAAYERSGLPDVERIHHAAESFDTVIADADELAAACSRPLHELARLLRPGGRLVLTVAPQRAAACTAALFAAGFLVVPAHSGEHVSILIGVRGEYAPATR